MGDKQLYIDQRTKAVLTKYGLPNLAAVLVRDNGQTVIHSAQGVRDSSLSANAASNKVTKNDYFNVGSISKPITGFLLACLIKQNVLSWNTKIADVFPEFRAKAFRDRCGMNENFLDTKVYELMSHTSGINGTYFHTLNGKPSVMNSKGEPVDNSNGDYDPYRFIADQGIQWKDNSRGKEWQNMQAVIYQRYLYAVLSLKKDKYVYGSSQDLGHQNTASYGYGSTATICASMVERKTGKPFETVMTGLLSTTLQLQIMYGKMPNGMQFHAFDAAQDQFVPQPVYNNDFAPYLSKFVVGGIHMTVEGMAQYIKYNLRAIDHSNVFNIAEYQAPVTGAAKGGLFLGNGTNHEPLYHKGMTGASIALMYVYPHSGFGYAVMQNCNGGKSDDDNQADAANSELFGELAKMHHEWDTI